MALKVKRGASELARQVTVRACKSHDLIQCPDPTGWNENRLLQVVLRPPLVRMAPTHPRANPNK